MELAKKHNIWVILGSIHFICENEKPLNCLYIISNEGKIIDRYDKSMLTPGDTNYYSAGKHIVKMMVLPADEKYNNGKPSKHYRATDTKSLP